MKNKNNKDNDSIENLEKNDKHYYHKAFAVGCVFMVLYQFVEIHIYVAKFADWQSMLLSVFGQFLNVIIGYVFTLLFRLKSENLKIIIMFIISTLLDTIVDYEFMFDFSDRNIVLISVIIFVLLLNILNYVFNKPIKAKIEKVTSNSKRRKLQFAYLIITLVLLLAFFSLIIIQTVLYYSNHPFRWTTTEPVS